MSQLRRAAANQETGRSLHISLCRFEHGWQEPDEPRGSRPDLRGTGGEIPPVYAAAISQQGLAATCKDPRI